jgi:hypothetical protein
MEAIHWMAIHPVVVSQVYPYGKLVEVPLVVVDLVVGQGYRNWMEKTLVGLVPAAIN